MRIGVLGTGGVGQTLASALVRLGHAVRMGSRTAGNEAAVAWATDAGESVGEGAFADAAGWGATGTGVLNVEVRTTSGS